MYNVDIYIYLFIVIYLHNQTSTVFEAPAVVQTPNIFESTPSKPLTATTASASTTIFPSSDTVATATTTTTTTTTTTANPITTNTTNTTARITTTTDRKIGDASSVESPRGIMSVAYSPRNTETSKLQPYSNNPIDERKTRSPSQMPMTQITSPPLIIEYDDPLDITKPQTAECVNDRVSNSSISIVHCSAQLLRLLDSLFNFCIISKKHLQIRNTSITERNYLPNFAQVGVLHLISKPRNMEQIPLELRIVQTVFDVFDESIGASIAENLDARFRIHTKSTQLQEALLHFLKELISTKPEILLFCRDYKMYDVLFSNFFFFIDEFTYAPLGNSNIRRNSDENDHKNTGIQVKEAANQANKPSKQTKQLT